MSVSRRTEAAEELLHRMSIRKSLKSYVHNVILTRPGYHHGEHIDRICDEVDDFLQSDDRFLILTCPPRHMKSTIISECLPAWLISNDPQKEAVVASYNQEQARKASRSARQKFSEPEHVRVYGETEFEYSSADEFMLPGKLNGRPNFIGAGIGTGLTGSGADVLIIDDPVKDAVEAYSPTYRERAWDWFTQVAYTRLSPGGKVIIIMTRWHHDDLVGRLLDENPDKLRYINMPAISPEGEALWPVMFPIERLRDAQELNGKAFTAMYQGTPTTDEGDIFKREWWRWYDTLPDGEVEVIQSWDTAFGKGQENDYSVCWTLMKDELDNVYALDMVRGRWNYPELKKVAKTQFEKHRPSIVLIEDQASGQSLIQELRSDSKIPVKAMKAVRSKEARASAVSARVEGGKVFLPRLSREHDWTAVAIEECAEFPAGTHDDIVDALVYGLSYLTIHPDQDVMSPAGVIQNIFRAPDRMPRRRGMLPW